MDFENSRQLYCSTKGMCLRESAEDGSHCHPPCKCPCLQAIPVSQYTAHLNLRLPLPDHELLKPLQDTRYLEGSLARYRMFLHLMRRTRGTGLFCVPTYDVDLMWHAHQLCPFAYAQDCQGVMGKLVDHDDT